LQPFEQFEPYSYPICPEIDRKTDGGFIRGKISEDVARELLRCAPTPDGQKSITTEIKANTGGELFLYVNDAVLMLPGQSDLFFSNNTGTGTVAVEPITAAAR